MTKSWIAVWIALVAAAPAHAAEYYLEGPPQETRSDAAGMSRLAASEGFKARVVRRYRQGVGWQFLFRIEGFEAQEAAREAAELLAIRTGHSVSIYAAEEGDARVVERADPEGGEEAATAEPAKQVEGPELEPVDLEDPGAVLRRAVRAHGGSDAGAAAVDAAEVIVFRFRRTLPDGLVADHTWARRGDQQHLEVAVVEGEGRSSRTVVHPEEAWLAVDDGKLEPTDRARAVETLAQFVPDQVIPFVLVFASAVESRRELELMRIEDGPELDGRPVVTLRYDGDRASGAMRIAVDRETWHVLEVAFEEGELMHRYDGWHEVGPLVLPGTVRTWKDGELVDTVEIRELDLEASPPEAWFAAP